VDCFSLGILVETSTVSRFFAFGCSFTQYRWPTWADILGKTFEYYENWGQPGAGNQYIFNSLIECDIVNTINPSDTVGIMWTNVYREDYYDNKGWVSRGNIFNAKNYAFTHSTRGYYIRDLATIYASKKILDSIGCQYFFTSMVPILNVDQYSDSKISGKDIDDLAVHYESLMRFIRPSVFESVFGYDWQSKKYKPSSKPLQKKYQEIAGPDWPSFKNFMMEKFDGIKPDILKEILDENRWNWNDLKKIGNREDWHPTPLEHLEYLELILPEYPINDDIRNWTKQIDFLLRSNQDYTNLWNPVKIKRW